MKLARVLLPTFLSISLAAVTTAAFAAAPTFRDAVNDYNNRKYGESLNKLTILGNAYPGNIPVTYYKGMCYQALGKLSEARAQFQFVVDTKDPTYGPNAVKAVAALSVKGSKAQAVANPGEEGSFLSVTNANPNFKVAPPPIGNRR